MAIEYIAAVYDSSSTKRNDGNATQRDTPCIIDPFCGVGSVCAVANRYGFDTWGVERTRKRCKRAAELIF